MEPAVGGGSWGGISSKSRQYQLCPAGKHSAGHLQYFFDPVNKAQMFPITGLSNPVESC